MDDLLTHALQQLLQDQCTPRLVRAIEAGQSPADFWKRLEESGFADSLVPETHGGAGLTLGDVFPLLELCGNFVVPVPLAHTILAMVGPKIVRVRCNTCGGDHAFRGAAGVTDDANA